MMMNAELVQVETIEYVSPPSVIPMRRVWAMPSAETFSIPPIGALVKSYLRDAGVSVDPFARNKRWATHTNDINPETAAEHHMDAAEFLSMLVAGGVAADVGLFDPPYSPYQVIECYKGAGKDFSHFAKDGHGWKRHRDLFAALIKPGGYVLSFGWNSNGIGKERGFEKVEILLVAHGREHNDTICTVERKVESAQQDMFSLVETA
jgi:hypothetical protein